jgi:CRISPR-associated endonuclease Csn1
LSFLPEHYASQIDFEKRFGKFKEETEPKLAYNKNGFIFKIHLKKCFPILKNISHSF